MQATRGSIEAALINESALLVAGVDEVGRGCLAGPVYAACAVLAWPQVSKLDSKRQNLIRDSKTLSAKQRQIALDIIADIAIETHIAAASAREIEAMGIQGATFLAMRRALQQCRSALGMVLVDGNRPIADWNGQQQAIIKGDHLCFSIAAASIVAKEARDRYMREQSSLYPQYGFADHVGYGTRGHLAAIKRFGICDLHRRNFAPISQMAEIAGLAPHVPSSNATTAAAL